MESSMDRKQPQEQAGGAGEPGRSTIEGSRTPASPVPLDLSGLGAAEVVQRVFEDALGLGVRTLHIEPRPGGTQIRYLKDGRLLVRTVLGVGQHQSLVEQVRGLARLPPGEETFESGEMRVRHGAGSRAATLLITRTLQGEKLTVHFIDRALPRSLEDLGLEPRTYQRIVAGLAQGSGLYLSTGPSRSGKSAFSYAQLSHLQAAHLSIMTAEDPPQFRLPQADQIACSFSRGITEAPSLSSGSAFATVNNVPLTFTSNVCA